jgi:hypothetical protein
VEIFGHNSYGGVLQEVERLGAKFLRVTVPDCDRHREFSVELSAGSIFRMRECSEKAAREWPSTVTADVCKLRIGVPQSMLDYVEAAEDRDDDDPLEDDDESFDPIYDAESENFPP